MMGRALGAGILWQKMTIREGGCGQKVGLHKEENGCMYIKEQEDTSTFYWLSKVNQLIGNTEDIASELLKL